MSVTAFDDQYEDCTKEMESEVLQGLLAKEKKAVPIFGKTWDKAVETWKNKKWSLPDGIRKEYGFAITAYTDNNFYKDFHKAVKDYKGWDQFPYHSMHFLLTRALVLLRTGCPKTTTLFRGVKDICFKQKKGTEIRFGQFASSSTSKKEAEKFDKDTFFNLTSCFGVSIKNYSYFPYEEEVLIPVDEVFKVTSFTEEGGQTRFVLATTEKRCHNYNCNYMNKG
ncbi:ecto-ADP-ribosyltransferase 5-like [Rana temporaria]|uniref:ecto-ADP-ribosyltransferase 5-like n=1 Tax=Rana temporaria TaxID=8407 RepID=UPI001AACAAA0|nr:ecto-ADP-ribosyltransferase 5-like [Rana temporaria]